MTRIANIVGFIVLLFSPVFLAGQTVVSLSDTSVSVAEQVTIPINLELAPEAQLNGFHIQITYNNSHLTFVGLETDGTISDSTVNAINPSNGSILISMASTYPIETSGSLFGLIFEGTNVGETTVTVSSYRINEETTVTPGPSSIVRVYGEGGNQPPFVVDLPDTVRFIMGDTLRFTLDESLIADAEDAFENLKFSFTLDPQVLAVDYDEQTKQVSVFSESYIGFVTLYFRVEDSDGAILETQMVLEIIVLDAIDDEPENAQKFALAQNYPNPFNPSTVIRYQLAENSVVSLRVYDALGREVANLVDEMQISGSHEIKFDASALSSGVYIYRLQTPGFVNTRTMTLIK